jgi:hypothetical protein
MSRRNLYQPWANYHKVNNGFSHKHLSRVRFVAFQHVGAFFIKCSRLYVSKWYKCASDGNLGRYNGSKKLVFRNISFTASATIQAATERMSTAADRADAMQGLPQQQHNASAAKPRQVMWRP